MNDKASTYDYLPPVPRPPHDPKWLLLDKRAGWRDALKDNVEKTASGKLDLSLANKCGRSFAEKSGSFGGLRLPANIALGPGGDIYLLDISTVKLKRFDSCECRFDILPCIAGVGTGPRQLYDPHGIGICSGNLFVCDTGNNRLSIFSLRGFVLRAFWQPPDSEKLAYPWEPYGIAFDGKGRVFVTDRVNCCIHRFTPWGQWEKRLSGFNKASHIAIDCRDLLYVVVEDDAAGMKVVDAEGREQKIDSKRPDMLASRFPCFPFRVDAQGNLYLKDFCVDAKQNNSPKGQITTKTTGVFNLNGDLLQDIPTGGEERPRFEQKGLYISRALDSKIAQCQWHRIVLRGLVPIGARIIVATYTAETALLIEQIRKLPDGAWDTRQTVLGMDGNEWDCLIRSGQGRFLWLKLALQGNGSGTPVVESIKIEFPRISLRRYLPAVFGADPASADFTDRFLGIFDTTLRSIEKTIDEEARLFDPMSAPVDYDQQNSRDFLSWLASWIALAFDRKWSIEQRRSFLKNAGKLYHVRGTRSGLWRQLILILGMEPSTKCCPDDQPKMRCCPKPYNCEPIFTHACFWQPPALILEHYQLRRWLFLGAGRLGDQAVLWGKRIVNRSQLGENAQMGRTQLKTSQDPYRDPFHVYAHRFSVFVPASWGKEEGNRRSLENLINAEKPAHAVCQVEYVEPRFRIGFQSMIGFDSVVGRYPEGVILDSSALGHATILGEPPHKQGGPSFEIGKEARVGFSTMFR